MAGEDYTKIRGGAYTVTWGGVNLGTKGVMDLPPWFDLDAVMSEDFGGEPTAYLLRKNEVIVNLVIHQLEESLFKLWAGPWVGGEIDDDFYGGYNVSADANWSKELILTPRDGGAGRILFTFPKATPQAQERLQVSAKHFVTPVKFKCVRGVANYPVKWSITT